MYYYYFLFFLNCPKTVRVHPHSLSRVTSPKANPVRPIRTLISISPAPSVTKPQETACKPIQIAKFYEFLTNPNPNLPHYKYLQSESRRKTGKKDREEGTEHARNRTKRHHTRTRSHTLPHTQPRTT